MIFYYSRTKKTEAAAQVLHELTGLPLCALASEIDGTKGILFGWKALRSALGKKGAAVANLPENLPAEIWLCGPVWAGEPAGPVKFFIANAGLTGTKVNILLTAMMPGVQQRTAAEKALARAGAQAGEIILLATQKQPPEPEVLREQLREILNGSA